MALMASPDSLGPYRDSRLLETLSAPEREAFLETAEKLYQRSKAESRAGFPNVRKRLEQEE